MLSETVQTRLLQMLTTALGPKIGAMLNDPSVVEIMLNPDGKVWIDKLGEGMSYTGHNLLRQDAERVIFLVAGATNSICNDRNPILSAELPGSGERFQGILPPVSEAPVFCIRKKAVQIFTLEDYVGSGILSQSHKKIISQAVSDKQNILIVGGTGSGKTTLANAILAEIAKESDRVVILEDTLELQCTAENCVTKRTRDNVSVQDLLKATMRLRPDRIVVGEVRGGEALSLLKAWNTGHPGGLATVHANNARAGLQRLESLCEEAIPGNRQQELIAEAVDLVIYIERTATGRTVKQILKLGGLTPTGNYDTTEI